MAYMEYRRHVPTTDCDGLTDYDEWSEQCPKCEAILCPCEKEDSDLHDCSNDGVRIVKDELADIKVSILRSGEALERRTQGLANLAIRGVTGESITEDTTAALARLLIIRNRVDDLTALITRWENLIAYAAHHGTTDCEVPK